MNLIKYIKCMKLKGCATNFGNDFGNDFFM